MSTEPREEERFKPAEHFRSLKGQQYLETKWRLVWFRSEHPDGQVITEMLEHDAANGLAVFKANVAYAGDTSGGFTAIGTGHGSETRKDFADYLEKAETKAIGRALAVLGYGTQFAQELDEGLEKGGLSAAADSPVDAKPARAQTQRPPLRTANTAAEEDYAAVTALLRADTEGAEKLPKPPGQMTPEELRKTRDWLDRRARAIKKGQTVWVDPGNLPAGLYRARLAADDIGAAVDPNGAHIVEKAVDEARALLATITASGDKRPHAGDYDQMRTLLLCIQRADPWSGDADPDAIPPAELLPYMRARLAGYETAEAAV